MSRPLAPILAALLAAAGLLGVTPPASAGGLPGGNSAITQYLETVPTASGARPGTSVHPQGGATGGGSSALPTAVRARFARHGAAGRHAAALAAATKPSSPRSTQRGKSHSGSAASTGRGGTPPSGGSTPLSTLSKAITGGSGPDSTSPLLPALLVVIALAGGALALRRRRTS